ncbi:MAG: polysaccharide pyruvyl transferase family protein, partial [Bacteroidales bacterium]|nr:polysaccharide pyruvyl transferase family protein [Bacteroidales bacterium]
FENFINNDLRLSKKEYNIGEDLKLSDIKYDCYISGSDQIWNTFLPDFDPSYMLSFVKSGKKIAYAPSLGWATIKELSPYKNLIMDYDNLSVREKEGAQQIGLLIQKDVPVTLDPTLLVDPVHWNNMAGDKALIREDYVFGYCPRWSEETFSYTENIAKRLSFVPLSTMPFKKRSQHHIWPQTKVFLPVGPKEFLNLVKFSKFMVCHSFHAVVFSLIFEKPFICIGAGKDDRIKDLLEICQMQYRNIQFDQKINLEELNRPIPGTFEMLKDLRRQSLEWLSDALQS